MSLTATDIDLLVKMRELGQPYHEIAEQLGVCINNVQRWIVANRPDLRLVTKGIKGPRNPERIEQIKNLKKQKFTQSEIADIIGISRERVRQIVDKHCPEFGGRELMSITCDNCEEEHPQGKRYSKPNFIQKNYDCGSFVCLCRKKCWKPFSDYVRVRTTVENYADRYFYIQADHGAGNLYTGMGERYYRSRKLPVPPYALYPHWHWRVEKFYREAWERMQVLSNDNPWLPKFYDKVFVTDNLQHA